jgi:hypothetical protein
MCEIAVMAEDVASDDPVDDTKLFKLGDVIDILPDGADWGDQAIANPRFRMIRLTGVSVSEASVLVAAEMSTNPGASARMLRQRMSGLDLTNPDLAAAMKDVGRSTKVIVLPPNAARALLNGRKVKSVIPDPDQLGDVHSIGIPAG